MTEKHLPKGTKVRIIKTENGNWYRIGQEYTIHHYIEQEDAYVTEEDYAVYGEDAYILADDIEVVGEFDYDIVNNPPHYALFPEHNIEVKDVVKLWLSRWENNAKTELSFYNAACLKEMLCYILRSPLKNEVEDLKKARWYIDEVIKEMENKQ